MKTDDELYARIAPVLIPVMRDLAARRAPAKEVDAAYDKIAADLNVSPDDVWDACLLRADELERQAKITGVLAKLMKASAARMRDEDELVNIPDTIREGFPDIQDEVPDVTLEEVFEIANKDWGDFLCQQAH